MTLPWIQVPPLDPSTLARVRRRAIFDCCKWDPQVGDVSTVADTPILLTGPAWRELSDLAEAMAAELTAAEQELFERTDLHARLGLPRAVTEALHRGHHPATRALARLVRFDFHHTADGWRISEANTDVPGGMNEASGLPALVAPCYPAIEVGSAGDAAGALVGAVHAFLGDGAHVAMAHATSYTDDRQVMTYLANRLAERGVATSLVSPSHLRWVDGRASVRAAWANEALDGVLRFFPAEWLPNLPHACGWASFFRGGRTPVANPATAVLTQSKRFPLTWDSLSGRLPTWRARLPETRDPRDAPWERDEGWVLKPALGRVGEDVLIQGVINDAEWRQVARHVRRHPGQWVAQRRFASSPFEAGRPLHACVGVYTVNGRTAGAYGRLASRPLIDAQARDAAVLVARERPGAGLDAQRIA
jgi:glutathionylspermidine synthase